jgi:predicted nucleotidyltransferase
LTFPKPLRERLSRCVLIGYRGSVAHGTYQPADDPTSIDDKDVMGFAVPGPEVYFGLSEFGSRGTVEIGKGTDEWDVVVYEIRKAVRLLLGGNPNVLSMLWLPENLYIHRSPAGQRLIEERDAFVGKHVYRSYTGYAVAQARKMESGVHKGYMGDKRRALVEQFGYDCKNAAHLIRLLRQGIEFLTDGELYVHRHDAPELLAIKRGEWTLERVKDESERLFAQAQDAYVRSSLPPRPDRSRVEALCIEIVRETLAEREGVAV